VSFYQDEDDRRRLHCRHQEDKD
jgi:hypothetical protein